MLSSRCHVSEYAKYHNCVWINNSLIIYSQQICEFIHSLIQLQRVFLPLYCCSPLVVLLACFLALKRSTSYILRPEVTTQHCVFGLNLHTHFEHLLPETRGIRCRVSLLSLLSSGKHLIKGTGNNFVWDLYLIFNHTVHMVYYINFSSF